MSEAEGASCHQAGWEHEVLVIVHQHQLTDVLSTQQTMDSQFQFSLLKLEAYGKTKAKNTQCPVSKFLHAAFTVVLIIIMTNTLICSHDWNGQWFATIYLVLIITISFSLSSCIEHWSEELTTVDHSPDTNSAQWQRLICYWTLSPMDRQNKWEGKFVSSPEKE